MSQHDRPLEASSARAMVKTSWQWLFTFTSVVRFGLLVRLFTAIAGPCDVCRRRNSGSTDLRGGAFSGIDKHFCGTSEVTLLTA